MRKRRTRTVHERRRVVEETFQPGASVALVAQAHDVRANQVFHWRKLYREGRLDTSAPAPTQLLPVRLMPQEDLRDTSLPTVPGGICTTVTGVIYLDLGQAQIRVEGAADPHCLRAVLETLGRR